MDLSIYFVILAFIVVVVGIFFLFYFMKPKGSQLDERQIAVQGKAYRLGFILMVVSSTGEALLSMLIDLTDPMTYLFSSVCLSITGYAIYAIWNDAFFGVNTKIKQLILIWAVLGCYNLYRGISDLLAGKCIHASGRYEGLIGGSSVISLITGVMMVIVVITILVKKLVSKTEDE